MTKALIKQKKLNEQYYNQYLEDLNKKINDFTNGSTKVILKKHTL